MTVPPEMAAVEMRAPGGAGVLELVRRAVPEPAPGEVLIRVEAAGVNRADVLQRHGRYPLPADASPVFGLEVAGEIASLGTDVAGWHIGERVCTLTDGGGYAEFALAPAVQLLRWPRGYDAVGAASLPEAMFTVWANVFQMGGLRRGETLLVHGGRGGVGTTAIQLTRARGSRVLATTGSADGLQQCVALGAERAIDYRNEDFVAAVNQATQGGGADVILDPVGGSNFARNLAALAMDGRLVMIGFAGGREAERVDLSRILTRRLVVTGSAMRPRSTAEKAAIAAQLATEVWPLLDAGECRPVLAEVFPLAAVAAAHQRMEAGGYFGKIVLTMGG